ncbi:MAG: PAS domain S-box protein [Syntrophus sp. (in: bacteria)]
MALQESEERYRTLVENASDAVFRTDENGYFTFVNSAMLRITGYEEGEIIGKHYKMFIRPDMFKQAITFFTDQLMKGLQNTYSEYPILTKEGHEVWLGQNTQLIMKEDHVTGFQAVARDITERKRMEKELNDSE